MPSQHKFSSSMRPTASTAMESYEYGNRVHPVCQSLTKLVLAWQAKRFIRSSYNSVTFLGSEAFSL